MPKLEYFLVCESVSIDRETNRISLFNVIEDIHRVKPGAQISSPLLHNLVAVSCWNKVEGDDDTDFQATLRIHQPPKEDGEDSEPKDLPHNFRMQSRRQRLLMRLATPVLPPAHDGKLRLELLLNGNHVAEHEIGIIEETTDDS